MQIYITLSSGASRTVDLGRGGLVVGGSAVCDIVLEGPGVAPRHAFFQEDVLGAATVQEMGTNSPVLVNGSRIRGTVTLKSSDRVDIAGARFSLAPSSGVPLPPPPAVAPTAAAHSSGPNRPLVLALIGAAVLLAVGLLVVALNLGGEETPGSVVASTPRSAGPPGEPPSGTPPTSTPASPTPSITQARVDGLYTGRYDFTFKPDCSTGPCGGVAQSGAQFRIPYSGRTSYRGHSEIRATCRDGGVHVQAPYKVDLNFHSTAGAMVGDEWIATKVDIDLTVSRHGVVKKIRTGPRTVTTLTCRAYKKNVRFTGVIATDV